MTDELWAALQERVFNSEGLYARLREMRGGCSCHISPPCSCCCEPMTEEEFDMLGLLDDGEQDDRAEPQRPALEYFPARAKFDPFGPEFIVGPSNTSEHHSVPFLCARPDLQDESAARHLLVTVKA